jgi:hypothetical protein
MDVLDGMPPRPQFFADQVNRHQLAKIAQVDRPGRADSAGADDMSPFAFGSANVLLDLLCNAVNPMSLNAHNCLQRNGGEYGGRQTQSNEPNPRLVCILL